MTPDHVNTVIVGGGQAGLAMSAHLSEQGIDHLVIERDRIAERWRTARWDSLVANGPAWHDRFPMLEFEDCDGDGFPTRDSVVRYFETVAERINAPMRCGVEVKRPVGCLDPEAPPRRQTDGSLDLDTAPHWRIDALCHCFEIANDTVACRKAVSVAILKF